MIYLTVASMVILVLFVILLKEGLNFRQSIIGSVAGLLVLVVIGIVVTINNQDTPEKALRDIELARNANKNYKLETSEEKSMQLQNYRFKGDDPITIKCRQDGGEVKCTSSQ